MKKSEQKIRTFREVSRTRRVDNWYRRQLKQVAAMIDLIAREYQSSDPQAYARNVQMELFDYAETLEQWADLIARQFIARVDEADRLTWRQIGDELAADTKRRIRDMRGDPAYREMIRRQVDLIKSLPTEAAAKAQEIARQGMANGERYADIVDRIAGLGKITESRAVLIARTESSRARTDFTMMRAKAAGSTKFIWHTAGDGAVRESHRKLDGKIFDWSNPPVCDHGKGGAPIRALPGQVFNCRCWSEPLFEKSIYEK